MPIKTFSLIPEGHGTKIKPGILTKKTSSSLLISLVNKPIRADYHGSSSHNVFEEGSSVYITSEIDSKITSINNNLELLKNEFSTEISKSLGEIQKQLVNLKEQIIKDQIFSKNITNSLINNETFLKKIAERIRSEENNQS